MSEATRNARAVISLLLGAFTACDPSSQANSATCGDCTAQSARVLLEDALWRGMSTSDIRAPFDSGTIYFDSASSSVVPGLRYYVAAYRSRKIRDGHPTEMAGARGGRVRRLISAEDWSALSNGWSPATAKDVRQACSELMQVIGGRLPGYPEFYDGPVAGGDDPFEGEPPELRRRVKDRVAIRPPTAADSSWMLTGWAIRPCRWLRAVKYDCRVPSTIRTDLNPVRLVVIDSVPRRLVVIDSIPR